jgi:hypothetical protein
MKAIVIHARGVIATKASAMISLAVICRYVAINGSVTLMFF